MKANHHRDAISRLASCIADVRSWATENKLMLNDSKTEIIRFHSKFRASSQLPVVKIGGSDIHASSSVKDLGVILDDTLQLGEHVRNISRKASFGIY